MMTEYDNFVAAQRQIDADSNDIVRLRVPEDPMVEAAVQPKGAMVLRCTLASEQGGYETVLSTASPVEDHTISKLEATHPMAPVDSPHSGRPDSQHSPLRWLPYEAAYKHTPVGSMVTLKPMGPPGPFNIVRTVRLARTSITLATALTNLMEHPVTTSIGERAYFAMPAVPWSPDSLLVNGKRLGDPLIGGYNALAALLRGQAIYWKNFNGQAAVQFPDGKRVGIEASLTREGGRIGPKELTPDMLVWHRPNTDTVCFEPIGGCVSGKIRENPIHDNHALSLQPKQSVRLTTTITLL